MYFERRRGLTADADPRGSTPHGSARTKIQIRAKIRPADPRRGSADKNFTEVIFLNSNSMVSMATLQSDDHKFVLHF